MGTNEQKVNEVENKERCDEVDVAQPKVHNEQVDEHKTEKTKGAEGDIAVECVDSKDAIVPDDVDYKSTLEDAAKQFENYGDRYLDGELLAINKLDESIKNFNDLKNMDNHEVFERLVRHGMDLETAFKTANYEKLMRKGMRAARQSALNSVNGRCHLAHACKGTHLLNTVEMPADALKVWRRMYPGKSTQQLQQYYNEVKKVYR